MKFAFPEISREICRLGPGGGAAPAGWCWFPSVTQSRGVGRGSGGVPALYVNCNLEPTECGTTKAFAKHPCSPVGCPRIGYNLQLKRVLACHLRRLRAACDRAISVFETLIEVYIHAHAVTQPAEPDITRHSVPSVLRHGRLGGRLSLAVGRRRERLDVDDVARAGRASLRKSRAP